MKSLVFICGCTGTEINKFLKKTKTFNKLYVVTLIYVNHYMNSYKNESNFIEKDLESIKNADVILYIPHVIKPFFSIENIKTIAKSQSVIYKIPAFSFYGYHYKFHTAVKIDVNLPYQKIINIIDNKYSSEDDLIKSNMDNELKKLLSLDNTHDIKVHDLISDNYKNHLLFYSPNYPSSYFCYLIAKQILELLDINPCELSIPNNLIDATFSWNMYYPIFPHVKKVLDLDFDVDNIRVKNIIVSPADYHIYRNHIGEQDVILNFLRKHSLDDFKSYITNLKNPSNNDCEYIL